MREVATVKSTIHRHSAKNGENDFNVSLGLDKCPRVRVTRKTAQQIEKISTILAASHREKQNVISLNERDCR